MQDAQNEGRSLDASLHTFSAFFVSSLARLLDELAILELRREDSSLLTGRRCALLLKQVRFTLQALSQRS